MTIPNPDNAERTRKVQLLKEAKEAFTEVRRQNGLSLLFMVSILGTFFIMPVSVLYPLMTLNHYSGNAYQISLVEIAWGIGALLGGTFLSLKKFRLNEISLINWMYILLGFTFVLSGILPVSGYPLFVLLTAIGGISGSLYMASFTTVVQARIDPVVMGRVFSFYMSVNMFPSMIGLLSTGFLADTIGIGNTFMIGGVLVGMIGGVSFFLPSIEDLRNSFRR